MSTTENHPRPLLYQPWNSGNRSLRLAAIRWELSTLATLFDVSDADSDSVTSLLIPSEFVENLAPDEPEAEGREFNKEH